MDKIKIKTSWESITYAEFEQLMQIADADIPEQYKTSHLISVLTGEDINTIEELPIKTYLQLANVLSFMNEQPKDIPHKDEYVVNGRKYLVQAEVDKICTAQFLDYTNYSKEEKVSNIKLASCFLVPEGHKYGDGYDLKQVWFDIGRMNFMDLKALAFFLQLQYATYLLISTDFTDQRMKKMGISKKKRREVITHLNSMVRSLLSSNLSN